MQRRKLFFILVALILVSYAVRPVFALCPPNDTCGCVCVGGGTTGDYEGSGSTCTQASASAKSQAYAEVAADCSPDGTCSRSYVVLTACHWDSTAQVYKEVGYARYRCQICE
jgi:hypothetical protein